jgi:hypothetical protein
MECIEIASKIVVGSFWLVTAGNGRHTGGVKYKSIGLSSLLNGFATLSTDTGTGGQSRCSLTSQIWADPETQLSFSSLPSTFSRRDQGDHNCLLQLWLFMGRLTGIQYPSDVARRLRRRSCRCTRVVSERLLVPKGWQL